MFVSVRIDMIYEVVCWGVMIGWVAEEGSHDAVVWSVLKS